MKKLFALLLILCLLFVGAQAWLPGGEKPSAPAASEPEAPTPVAADTRRIDFEALYSLYPADTVYATVGERTVTWAEYYEQLGAYILSLESTMDLQAAYGYDVSWESEYQPGVSIAAQLPQEINNNLRMMAATDAYAAENGVVISDADVEARRLEDMKAALGEDATEEDWAALLRSSFLTDSQYRAQTRVDLAAERLQETLYGAEGERISAARMQHFIEDYGLIHCGYLVFLTEGLTSSEELAARKAQAEDAAAELRAVPAGKARAERFQTLGAALSEEDEGVYLVDSLLFQSGSVPALIEDSCGSLYEFQVSDPVGDEYGYYVFLRLPIDAQTRLDDGRALGPIVARSLVLAERDALAETLSFDYAEGVEPVDLLKLIK